MFERHEPAVRGRKWPVSSMYSDWYVGQYDAGGSRAVGRGGEPLHAG